MSSLQGAEHLRPSDLFLLGSRVHIGHTNPHLADRREVGVYANMQGLI